MTQSMDNATPELRFVSTPMGSFTVLFSREYGAVGTIDGATAYVCTCSATDGQCHGSEAPHVG